MSLPCGVALRLGGRVGRSALGEWSTYDQDAALIVTIGRQNDPASLGPQPDNVLVHPDARDALGRIEAITA